MGKRLSFLSSPAVLLISAGLMGLISYYFGTAGNPVPQGAQGIFALQLAFFPLKFVSILDSWGGQGVQVFTGTMWLDFIFPLAYAFFFSGCLAFFLKEKAAEKNKPGCVFAFWGSSV